MTTGTVVGRAGVIFLGCTSGLGAATAAHESFCLGAEGGVGVGSATGVTLEGGGERLGSEEVGILTVIVETEGSSKDSVTVSEGFSTMGSEDDDVSSRTRIATGVGATLLRSNSAHDLGPEDVEVLGSEVDSET